MNKNKVLTVLKIVSQCMLFLGLIILIIIYVQDKSAFKGPFGILGLQLAIAGLVFSIVVRNLAANYRKKALGTQDAQPAHSKESIANYAFNKLLVSGQDYTVVGSVGSAILVKKIIKWAYFDVGAGGGVDSIFTITTDIDTFAFQVKEDNIYLIPKDLALSMYEFKD